jgi:signal transduction histidine kinase
VKRLAQAPPRCGAALAIPENIMQPRQSVWPVIFASLLVALAAAVSVYGLNRWAGKSAETELKLVDLRGALNALDGLEWRAISYKQIDAELDERIEAALQRADELLETIATGTDAQALVGLHRQYVLAMKQEFALIKAGELDQAVQYDEAKVDPAFEKLAEEIAGVAMEKGEAARRVSQHADLGMALSLLLAAGSVGGIFARFTRARERQASALKQALHNLQQAQDQLVQSGKLAALGQLVAGIAHEVNTPLGAIRAAAGNAMNALQAALAALPDLGRRLDAVQQAAFFALLRESLGGAPLQSTADRRTRKRALAEQLDKAGIDDSRRLADLLLDIGVHERLDEALPLLRHPDRDWLLTLAYDLTRLRGNSETILDAVERASKVVFALKNYARVDHSQDKQPVDLRASIETVLSLYGSQIKQGIEVQRDFADVPPISGHADELVQVWTNLIHNAMHAMDGRGRLHLRSAQHDGHAVVSVTDSGPGVPADLQQRIFEPFFSTKARGEGTGLGLHICQQIIAKHGGVIRLDSAPGKTTFSVRLPLETAVSI